MPSCTSPWYIVVVGLLLGLAIRDKTARGRGLVRWHGLVRSEKVRVEVRHMMI